MKTFAASLLALTLLGTSIASAAIMVRMGGHDHHRHRICYMHHHHRVCSWR